MGDYGMEEAYSGSPVLMVYGLNPEKMNCDRLFNVLCLYGNVSKVKMFKLKVNDFFFLKPNIVLGKVFEEQARNSHGTDE